MTVDTRVAEILDRWEETREEGCELTPEELCAECPELLDEVRRQIQALQNIDDRLRTKTRDASTQITDDGLGFDPVAARGSGGMGLPGIEERVERLGPRERVILDLLDGKALLPHRFCLRTQIERLNRRHPGLQSPDVAGVGRPEQRRDTSLKPSQQPSEEEPEEFPDTFQYLHGFEGERRRSLSGDEKRVR